MRNFVRSDLKLTARNLLTRNYWWIILVTIIFSVVGGGLVTQSLSGTLGTFNLGGSISSDMSSVIGAGAVSMFLLLLVNIFALNPIIVGCRRYYLINRATKPRFREILHNFTDGYLNTVKVMFLMDLFLALWTLLLIVPGVVKLYSYRMIPYLLAENPHMDYHEAFSRSKNLMYGNKWDAFVLDLSFILWDILSSFTFNILALFYVNPYRQLVNVELYVCLCQGRQEYDEKKPKGPMWNDAR